jgi:hypothetical protein
MREEGRISRGVAQSCLAFICRTVWTLGAFVFRPTLSLAAHTVSAAAMAPFDLDQLSAQR